MALCSTAATIKFTVRRRPAVLVTPASPTPRELKRLSDIDGQDSLRKHVSIIHFYQDKQESSMVVDKQEQDPAVVIRHAVARALVPYYPFAGRLRELDVGKLSVDCTADGVLFVEADADVRLEQFGAALLPPFPCVEDLIFDVPGSSAIIDTPLLLFQVTRLACGGFILAVRLNHTMADGAGVKQFLDAVAELARGDAHDTSALTVRPVWEHHLLDGRRRRNNPTTTHHRQVTRPRTETDSSSSIMLLPSLAEGDKTMVLRSRSFFFGPDEMAAIRAQLSPELQARASRFDVIAGWLWKCRTTALALDADEPALLVFAVDVRGRRRCRGAIPTGYYGNALALPAAVSTAGELRANPVSYAVGLVKEAKDKVADVEYIRSAADLIVLRGRQTPRITVGLYSLSDMTKARFEDLDLGCRWGRPVYGGLAHPGGAPSSLPWASSFLFPFKNAEGDHGTVVPVCLPLLAMDRLVYEMGKLRRRPAGAAIIKRSGL